MVSLQKAVQTTGLYQARLIETGDQPRISHRITSGGESSCWVNWVCAAIEKMGRSLKRERRAKEGRSGFLKYDIWGKGNVLELKKGAMAFS